MSQAFSHWFVVMGFKVNQDFIAKNLCENRYRPKLNCNGNCVLMKKLKEQEKKDQNQPATLKLETSTIIISSSSFFTITIHDFSIDRSTDYFDSSEGKEIRRSRSVFHPPQA